MPCDELIETFENARKAGEEFITLPPEDPFARAVEAELAKKSIRLASSVRMYTREKFTVQVDMIENGPYGPTRKRDVINLLISELHDMAVLYLPPIDPTKPLTFHEMRKHFHPNAPKDLLDKPLAPMRRVFIEVATPNDPDSPYHYDESWEFVEPKADSTKEEKSDKEKFLEAQKTIQELQDKFIQSMNK